MTQTKFERISRPLTAEENARHAEIREQVMQTVPDTLSRHKHPIRRRPQKAQKAQEQAVN